MVLRLANPWESEDRAGLVSIGTHQLFVSTSGPVRRRNAPVVIYFTGGGSPVASHVRLQRLMSDIARVYFYDRSGYDRSELPPQPAPLAEDAAHELQALLKAIRVGPPYILVAHSYGAMPAREFLALNGDAVAGMVLVDTATELMFQLYPHVPSFSLLRVASGVDWEALTHLKEESGLTDEEYQAAIEATERSAKGAAAEDNRESGRRLVRKQQFTKQSLGSRPLYVLGTNGGRDYRLLYDEGVRLGNGNKDDRVAARQFMDTWELFDVEIKTGQLRLSTCSKWQYIQDCGHDIPMRRPEVVVKAVGWVVGQCSR